MEIILALLLITGPVTDRPGGGGVTGASEVHRNDDVPLTLGNTAAAPDAKLLWDTSGTHQLQIWLTDVDGGGTDGVPMYWLTGDGTTYLGGDLDLASATSIVENSGGLLQFNGPVTSGYGLGAGHSAFSGSIEVVGTVYTDGLYTTGTITTTTGQQIRLGSNAPLCWGASCGTDNTQIRENISYTQLLWVLGSDQGRQLVFGGYPGVTQDFDHPTPTDPEIYLHSDKAPNTDNGEFSAWSWRDIKLGGDGGGYGCINETFAYSDMVDGGGASGTFDMTEQIPDGAVVQRAGLHTLTGFTGDTSATITIGDGTDVDRYNTGTPSVFTTNASGVDLGVPSGTAWHDDAATVTVTITSNADFTSVSAGQATVFVCYWTP